MRMAVLQPGPDGFCMHKLHTLLFALPFALGLANAGQFAEAGLIVSGDGACGVVSEPVESGAGNGAAFAESSAVSSSADEGDDFIRAQVVQARPAANPDSGGGMAPPSPEPSVQARALAVEPDMTPLNYQQMSGWVGAEGRAALAPPISTGIFRPPRLVG